MIPVERGTVASPPRSRLSWSRERRSPHSTQAPTAAIQSPSSQMLKPRLGSVTKIVQAAKASVSRARTRVGATRPRRAAGS